MFIRQRGKTPADPTRFRDAMPRIPPREEIPGLPTMPEKPAGVAVGPMIDTETVARPTRDTHRWLNDTALRDAQLAWDWWRDYNRFLAESTRIRREHREAKEADARAAREREQAEWERERRD